MGRETVLFKSEEKKDVKNAAQFLRDLADKIDQQKVVFKQGNKTVKVKIPGTVELEVKVEKEEGRKRSKKKIEVEIEWVVGGDKKITNRSVKLG